MRIGFDITPLSVPQSGVGTYTLNLLEQLAAQPGDEILALNHRPVHDPAALRNCPVTISPPSLRHLNKTLWMQLVLPWQLAQGKAEVSHFTNSVAPLTSPCATVVTIHDMTLWLFPQHHYRRRLMAMRPFIPLVARRAAAVIAVSESAKSDIVRLLSLPAAKVHVVHEAPPPNFRQASNRKWLEQVRARYSLSIPFFLYVGTIEPRKNLVRLLEAFAELRKRAAVNHSLVFVGSRGWKSEPVFEAVQRLGLQQQVRFLNHIPESDLVGVYNLAHALVFPSLYEGFGLPVVEAMACGTPVITSSRGSLGEIAADAAWFIDPLDVGSIAEGLHRVAVDGALQDELRARGLVRAAHFTWQRTATQTRQLYAEVRQMAG